jgi:hypothetical protein
LGRILLITPNFMTRSYKNFWSLNTDEAVVIGILRDYTAKNIEIFMPANAQMKDVDLAVINLLNNKVCTIQIKGSRAYDPKKKESEKFGDGSGCWFSFHKDVIQKNSVDCFVFLCYILENNLKTGKKTISPHTITIPTKELRQLCNENKIVSKKGIYNFSIWVNPTTKKVSEFRDEEYDLSDYLDKKGTEKINIFLE